MKEESQNEPYRTEFKLELFLLTHGLGGGK